jgi:23S rRNA (guanosine2251-2'-O)-methyltransferase
VRDTCDLLVQLPMRGQIESLNASVAGGIALYALLAARRFSVE